MNQSHPADDELRMVGVDPRDVDPDRQADAPLVALARATAALRTRDDSRPQWHNDRCRLADAARSWRTANGKPRAEFDPAACLRIQLAELDTFPVGALRVAFRHYPTDRAPESYAKPGHEQELATAMVGLLRRMFDPDDQAVTDADQAARTLVGTAVTHAQVKLLLWLLPDTEGLTATTDPDDRRANGYLVTPGDPADLVARRMAVAALRIALERMADQIRADVDAERVRYERQD